jgi:hypothetical protein
VLSAGKALQGLRERAHARYVLLQAVREPARTGLQACPESGRPMTLHVPQKPVEALAQEPPPDVTLTRDERDRIAHLALEIAIAENRRGGNLSPVVPYLDRTEDQKAAARLTVVRVIQAMTMLGYLER